MWTGPQGRVQCAPSFRTSSGQSRVLLLVILTGVSAGGGRAEAGGPPLKKASPAFQGWVQALAGQVSWVKHHADGSQLPGQCPVGAPAGTSQ